MAASRTHAPHGLWAVIAGASEALAGRGLLPRATATAVMGRAVRGFDAP